MRLSPASRWKEKLHHPPALRASVELGRPPHIHDCRLGSPINEDTEGHTDSIMAKHRKERDSWGECTYNISYFQRALTDLFPSIIPSRRGRRTNSCLFQAPPPKDGLHFGTFVANVYFSRPRCGWWGEKLRDAFLCFVWYCGPVVQKRADMKEKKKPQNITFWKMFLKCTRAGRFCPPPERPQTSPPPRFYFDRWASQGLCAASAIKLCNVASVNLTTNRFKALLLS